MTKLTNYKLLPYTDYKERGHKIPVFKKFISENKELLYCGVNHTYDPDHDLFNQLRKRMEDFNPNLIILEGCLLINPGNPKREAYFKSVLTKSYRQIVEEDRESGFAVKYALEKNIDVFCAEPEFEEQVNYLGQKYNTGQIFVNQILKMAVQFYTINDGSSIKEYLINEVEGLKSKLAQNTKWKKFDFSYDNFLLIFKEEFQQGFLDCTNEFIIEINDPIPWTTKSYDWTTNNQVTQDEGNFRDNLILNKISQKSKNYSKILVVYGGSHYYAQERGLESIYKNINIQNIQIRKAESLDIPYILMLEKLADISNILKGRSNDKLEKILYNSYTESKQYFTDKFKSHQGYVVILDESIIGCGFLLDQNKSYIIQTVYIEPSFQGQGVGTQLMKFLINKSREDMKDFIELETATAEGFYRKLGFVDIPDSFKMVLKLD